MHVLATLIVLYEARSNHCHGRRLLETVSVIICGLR
jgi:hypothetical protein